MKSVLATAATGDTPIVWPTFCGRILVAMVTNIPAPYRLPVYERLAAVPGLTLRVFFCSGREADRQWDVDPVGVPHEFLRERVVAWRGRFIHANPDIWTRLADFGPDVVVTTGFNPTHLLAFFYARRHGLRHVAMTDGTERSERGLTPLHRGVRRWVYRRSDAFVGAGEGSLALYRGYGVSAEALFKSRLCARDNRAFAAAAFKAALATTASPRAEVSATGGGHGHGTTPPRELDFIFCGRFVAGKLPLFAIDVAAATSSRLGRTVRMLFVGAGPMEAQMRRHVASLPDMIEGNFAGFAAQSVLPRHYARAAILLFPTLHDPWGVVANEAAAAGVPVLVSPEAGVAGDLIVDGVNGRVLPRDVDVWAAAAAELLASADAWHRMSSAASRSVAAYTPAGAALGLASAIAYAMRLGGASRRPLVPWVSRLRRVVPTRRQEVAR